MSRKAKQTGELRNSFQEELESKRKKYREWVEKNPYLMDHGRERKECESCYCLIIYNSGYDFCWDCLDAEGCGHSNYNSEFGNCCACFDPKSSIKTKRKRKKLTFAQKQRFYWEEVKSKAENIIDEIKDEEDIDDMRAAKEFEDFERHRKQEEKRTLEILTIAELYREIEKKKLLHKKEIINCCDCGKKINQWEFSSLEWQICPSCKEKRKNVGRVNRKKLKNYLKPNQSNE